MYVDPVLGRPDAPSKPNPFDSRNSDEKRHDAQMKELGQLSATAREIAESNEEIKRLNERQVELQTKMVDELKRQTAIQQQQLVTQKMQTQMMQVTELRQRRQRELKAAAFAIRSKAEEVAGAEDPLLRMFILGCLDQAAREVGLTAGELEELADKEYVDGVLKALSRALDAAATEAGEAGADARWLLERGYRAAERQLAAAQDASAKARQARAALEAPLVLPGLTEGFGPLTWIFSSWLYTLLWRWWKRQQAVKAHAAHVAAERPKLDAAVAEAERQEAAARAPLDAAAARWRGILTARPSLPQQVRRIGVGVLPELAA